VRNIYNHQPKKRKALIIMNNKQDKGFTLVELLIVIVILGILATVTVFAVRGITDKGKQNSCAVEKKTIETAIESYYAQNGTPPADNAWGVLDNGKYLNDDTATLQKTWTFTGGTSTTKAVVSKVTTGGAKCATFTP
jgi:prepilin-type N-terminal cleavage/methylation domain-containing protein